MGLSTKQVSGDHGLDNWAQSLLQPGGMELPKPPPARRQPPQHQSEPLPCPRCASTNTKFCYYNNYNKSQPRHFCKACKRHWTKGGTLRNVPVGGGRKNKRPKRTATATTSTSTTSMTSKTNTHMGIQSQQQCNNLPLALGDQILQQAWSQPESINSTTGNFMGSTLPLLPNQTLPFTFSSLSSFERNPSSISTSFRSLEGYNFTGGLVSMEDKITSIASDQPWQVPTTSSVMDMPNYWIWDDIESLVSTELNMPWDENEVKP